MPAKKKDKPETKKAVRSGRPSSFTQEIAEKICSEVGQGRSLVSITAGADMPHYRTVIRWLADPAHEQFRLMYARAREEQQDYYVDQIHQIAQYEEDVNRARLRIDAIKWTAAKLRPRVYGEKAALALTGEDGGPIKVETKSDLEVARRLAFILNRGAASDDASG